MIGIFTAKMTTADMPAKLLTPSVWVSTLTSCTDNSSPVNDRFVAKLTILKEQERPTEQHQLEPLGFSDRVTFEEHGFLDMMTNYCTLF